MLRIVKKYSVLIFTVIFMVMTGCEKIGNDSPVEFENTQLNKGPNRGYALSFDGVDDFVQVPDAPSLDLPDGFTITAWIQIRNYVEWASVVTKGGQLDGNNYTIHQSGPIITEYGHLRFTGFIDFPDGFPESESIIPLNEWHFIAVTFDGASVKFYLDGEPDGKSELPGTFITNDEALHIGVDYPGGDEYWDGLIDEVKIWNVPLRQVHIRAAMHGHATPYAKALVGCWTFDEGSGDIAYDRSKYANDGFLMGNPTWVSPGAPNP